jgi:hypothetical protein
VAIGAVERIAVVPDIEKLPHSGISAVADDGTARAQ